MQQKVLGIKKENDGLFSRCSRIVQPAVDFSSLRIFWIANKGILSHLLVTFVTLLREISPDCWAQQPLTQLEPGFFGGSQGHLHHHLLKR
jgi:hypothetical protein